MSGIVGEKILILNHTRIGDLIQTTPLIAALKAEDPTRHIALLANARFADILSFTEGIDETLLFDMKQFAADDGNEPDTLAVYTYLSDLLDRLVAERFDRVINLSHSKVSAVMTLAAHAGAVSGFDATPRGERVVRGAWLTYFTALLSFRMGNRFNLVDMYMKAGGVDPTPDARLRLAPAPGGEQAVRARMTERGLSENETLIGVQAGASREDRRWPPASFARAADELARRENARIVLFGAPAEKRLGDEVAAAMRSEPINLIGQTDLAELVSWVKRLSLLVTNDTGTMHIAAAFGVPIVALFFVHARAEETGPYVENALVLQADIECAPCSHATRCDHYSCLTRTTADDVVAAGISLLRATPLPEKKNGLFAGTLVLRPAFSLDDGMYDLWPEHRPLLPEHDLAGRILRPVVGEGLARWERPTDAVYPAEAVSRTLGAIARRYTPPPAAALTGWIDRGIKGIDRLAELAAVGERLARQAAAPADPARLAAAIEKNDADIRTVGETFPGLAPLTVTFRRRIENLDDLPPQALADAVVTAAAWLAHTAAMARRAYADAARLIVWAEETEHNRSLRT